MLLDPSEESVPALVAHFSGVIDALVSGTWRHYPLDRFRLGAARFVFDRQQLELKLTVDKKPRSFFPQPIRLRQQLSDHISKVVRAFRKFDYKSYSPILAQVFGADAVADPGSGIEELFPPKPVGRPRKQRLEAKTSGGSLRLIEDILFQATDGQTGSAFVMVYWKGRPIKEDTLSQPDRYHS